MNLDIQTIAVGIGVIIIALILLKFIIKIPLMLAKYVMIGLLLFALYLYFTGKM